MNYTSLFYWLVVADNMKSLFQVGITIFTIIALFATIVNIISKVNYLEKGSEDYLKDSIAAKKWIWWSYPLTFLFWSLFILTPSKRDSLLIVAGGGTLNFLTTDSTAKKIPHEMTNFVVTELKNMAKENEVELGINEQKEKVIEEAKKMSSEELINKIKTDSTFKKILVEEK